MADRSWKKIGTQGAEKIGRQGGGKKWQCEEKQEKTLTQAAGQTHHGDKSQTIGAKKTSFKIRVRSSRYYLDDLTVILKNVLKCKTI